MRRYQLTKTVLAAGVVALLSSYAQADDYSATLSGFNEIGALAGPTGAVLSNGKGTLRLVLDRNAGTADYVLTYSGLGSAVTQAHIHFGKVHVAGGVMVFFCTNGGNGPPNTPACPMGSSSGSITLSGTWTGASVVAITTQNVQAGNFNALVEALESNTAYANIHTTQFPAGEIRGQVTADIRTE